MSDILSNIGQALEAVFSWISTLLNSVSGIFYTAPTTSGGTGSFTFIGVLLLVAFGLSMVWVGINFVKSLVKRG